MGVVNMRMSILESCKSRNGEDDVINCTHVKTQGWIDKMSKNREIEENYQKWTETIKNAVCYIFRQ